MSSSPRILIAGAGWRVSQFVVPALLAVGVRREDITLVRRQTAEATGSLSLESTRYRMSTSPRAPFA
jgi:hypothetical protein